MVVILQQQQDGYDCDGDCLVDTDGDGICDQFEIAGCTDATTMMLQHVMTCYDNDLGCGCAYSNSGWL